MLDFQGVVFAELVQNEKGAYYSAVEDFLVANNRTGGIFFLVDYSDLPPQPNLEPFFVITDEQTFLDIDAQMDMYVDYYEAVQQNG